MEINIFKMPLINFAGINFNNIVAIILLLILAIYSVYSFLVYKQVAVLNKSIQTRGAFGLNLLALVHLIVSVTLLVLSVFIIVSS